MLKGVMYTLRQKSKHSGWEWRFGIEESSFEVSRGVPTKSGGPDPNEGSIQSPPIVLLWPLITCCWRCWKYWKPRFGDGAPYLIGTPPLAANTGGGWHWKSCCCWWWWWSWRVGSGTCSTPPPEEDPSFIFFQDSWSLNLSNWATPKPLWGGFFGPFLLLEHADLPPPSSWNVLCWSEAIFWRKKRKKKCNRRENMCVRYK